MKKEWKIYDQIFLAIKAALSILSRINNKLNDIKFTIFTFLGSACSVHTLAKILIMFLCKSSCMYNLWPYTAINNTFLAFVLMNLDVYLYGVACTFTWLGVKNYELLLIIMIYSTSKHQNWNVTELTLCYLEQNKPIASGKWTTMLSMLHTLMALLVSNCCARKILY